MPWFGSIVYFFGFDIDAIVGREDSTNIYQSLNVSIGTVTGNLEIFKFVPDHLKTKKNAWKCSYKITFSNKTYSWCT